MRASHYFSSQVSTLLRRDFLRVGGLSLLGLNLSQYLAFREATAATGSVPKAKAQSCILLWLEGGPSQVDTWDPKSNSNFKPISTNVEGIQISELLPGVAKHMDKLSIIRSMHTEEIDHPEAAHYAITGHRPNPAMQFPSLGSIMAKELGPRNGLPAYVRHGGHEDWKGYEKYFGPAFIGPKYAPMVVPDPDRKNFAVPDLSLPKEISLERIQDRRSLLQIVDKICRQKEEIADFSSMDTFTEQALNMILAPGVKEAFDLSQENEKIKDAYGRHGFGQSVLLARRLVEHGCRFVTAAGYKYNEWDSHGKNDEAHRDKLCPPLDQALSTLLEDLEQRGLLESTVVLVMGEFGRTPNINPINGRDHWSNCWSLALGGGGIKGGQIIGASDDRGAQVAAGKVTIGDLYATLFKALGIDWEKTYMTPVGRPIKLANSIGDATGIPIASLI
ncbi:MAG: DUF1501 domain-containing protein [Acidobacteriia bacterium]|nr:DUF1501 domain-containing protein [Terriglobia bacterium]